MSISLHSELSNREGHDFLLNWLTYRVTASGGNVRSAYVRFSDEELEDGSSLVLMCQVQHAMREVCRRCRVY